MMNPPTSERGVFRPAVFPIFAILFVPSLITAILTCLRYSPFTLLQSIGIMLAVSITVSAAVTFFVWRFTAEILSTDGVEFFTILGRRLLPWNDVAAVRTFPSLKLVCVRFSLASSRSRRILFFQRRRGEFAEMIADLVPRDSLVWRQLNDA